MIPLVLENIYNELRIPVSYDAKNDHMLVVKGTVSMSYYRPECPEFADFCYFCIITIRYP